MRLKLFLLTLLFALITASFHVLALHFSLYWIFPWFDAVVHCMGGVMAAFLLHSFLYKPEHQPHILRVVLMVLCIGIVWEIFEYSFGISSHELRYWDDTVSDLSFDVLGGLFGSYVSSRILVRSNAAKQQ